MAKAGRGQTRRDSKRRVLRPGESVRADGKYQYKYHIDGKPHFVYSWKLEPTDKLPKGKKPCFNHMVGRYNDIYRVQMPNITPHVCRHTYCSNMAKSGMNPKTLQYLMGHSDISVTMNVYTHISFDDAEEELKRMEEFRKAQAEIEKKNDAKAVSQKMFKVV